MTRLSDIAASIGARLQGPDHTFFKRPRIVIDTRTLWDAENTLFWALKGPFRSGEDFVKTAFEKGVRAAVVSDTYPLYGFSDEHTLLRVPDTLEALHKLAAVHRQSFRDTLVVAITGSNGKTIVKEWLAQCLEKGGKKVCKSPLSYNSQIGVPLSVWLLEEHHDIAVFEAGISKPGEMQRLQAILKPEVGIFSNLGAAHAAAFVSDEQKLHEKLILFRGCRALVFRQDGKFPGLEIEAFCTAQGIEKLSWGKEGRFRVQVQKKEEGKTYVVWNKADVLVLPFTEESNIENAMHAATLLFWLGWSHEKVQEVLLLLRPLDMRLSVEQGIRNTLLINDAYSSDPESFRIALGKLAEMAGTRPKTVVITDFEQVNTDWDFWQSVIEEVRKPLGLKRIITVGPSWKKRCDGLKDFICLDSTEELVRKVAEFNFHDEVVLFKGARRFQLEQAIAHLNRQTHQTWVEISVDALHHNLTQFRSYLSPATRIMVMLKAAAYGSGEGMAYAMRQLQADYVAVAYPDEGLTLRRQGYEGPVMVLHVPPALLKTALEHQLEPVVHSPEQWHGFLPVIRSITPPAVKIHLEVDTGMHRLGFPHDQQEKVFSMFQDARHLLEVKSIFSHLSGADEPTMDDFTRLQGQRFLPWVKQCKELFGASVLAHIANSAAAVRFAELSLDMVRLGIGFYGYGESLRPMDLKKAFSWYTTIIAVKEVPPGEPVGYGNDAISQESRKIAVLAVGYADGFSRKLGRGNWKVLLPGGRAPTVGRVCMDMAFVDVSDIQAKPGDQASVFHEGWGPEEMAKKLGTIPYEILTGINLRVRRIMLKE